MIFKQQHKGDCEIIFNDKEIEILNKQKKLILSPKNLRDFSNNLIHVLSQFYVNLPEEEQQRETTSPEIKIDD